MAKNFPALAIVGLVAELVFAFGLAGCDKKSGEAVVIEKEHIAAKEISETPASTPAVIAPEPTPEQSEKSLGPDEIAVDGYVMRRDDRGTSRDPRAIDHEQWIVTVRMVANLRQFNVQADQPRWEKLKKGDRVEVTYRVGKYTGTVWASKID